MQVNRREMLRWGTIGAGAAMVSSAASTAGLPAVVFAPPPLARDPLLPLTSPAPVPAAAAPTLPGLNPQLLAKAKAALDVHVRNRGVTARDTIGIVDFSAASREARFHLVDLMNGRVDSHLVAHGRGSDPDHSGFVERFSNQPGSEATSNGAYSTGEYYQGKYGLSMKVRGLDWSNNNAEARAIVIHNAWYAEPDMIALHGKLGRSEGCFAFSKASQWEVMRRLAGGRMIYADKLA
ncbi:murein L,D-transpeptidase catalytic domain family protein [Sphingomonas sp. BN140010]|uniref:Murein L,D-transpeptidase catalytic domain family protein n=1 Tax=Sphingomonas arvum TaxID=2992113 RepID=A0ABT3JB19_9SPHN|nr:murein L,D-transpeptidase catalytic domain family protein [Sphingomonas sp. BN140010]MCW3796259.1 murein L,D-transpeptidase catalytic domain family protein [Sphingomonas sp. BN140010]